MEPDNYIGRFVAACQADERVVASFLGGSSAAGAADEHSDLDRYLITTDEAYDDFFAGRETFIHRLGEPVFLEDFNGFGFDMVIFIFADGVEGELALSRESHFTHIHGGPFKALVDKKGLLVKAIFALQQPTPVEQRETLRWLVYWFWRDLSLFIKAMAREQLWAAYGHMEKLRLKCVNLARLEYNFAIGAEGYEKLDRAIPVQQLALLQATFCTLEPEAMLKAVVVIVQFYLDKAPSLARKHGVTYPMNLERGIGSRFEQLSNASLNDTRES